MFMRGGDDEPNTNDYKILRDLYAGLLDGDMQAIIAAFSVSPVPGGCVVAIYVRVSGRFSDVRKIVKAVCAEADIAHP
jgi:hypothetical protein